MQLSERQNERKSEWTKSNISETFFRDKFVIAKVLYRELRKTK
jgi:hypothetical protein